MHQIINDTGTLVMRYWHKHPPVSRHGTPGPRRHCTAHVTQYICQVSPVVISKYHP